MELVSFTEWIFGNRILDSSLHDVIGLLDCPGEYSKVTDEKNKLSILVVDDDPFVINIAVKVLNRLGYENIEAADNGKTALEKLLDHSDRYDIIILDLNMPEMDGVEFMGHATNSNFDGGIILLSGEDRRMLETALSLANTHSLNVLGALTKPMNLGVLKNMLNKFEPVSKEIQRYSPQKSITEEELKDGIKGSADNEPLLVFQPKISIKTGEIVSVETLARWRHAERGTLGPDTFIPLAEKTGLIDELSHVIYRKAIIQSAEWARHGRQLTTAINFSVNSFSKREFTELLVDIAEQYGVGFEQIILEITETQAMTIAVDCLEALIGMRLKRFALSIDDFGTGNSSMSQLKDIPFTELKIDRAFVNGAANNSSALAILETSINLARKLGMKIVAEGAETREDWDMVEKLGCDYVQGFYCAKPMPNEDLMKFMDEWTGPHQSK